MIYFLQSEPGGNVKIGTTTCLTRRRQELEQEHKAIFSVIGVIDGGYAEEHALHLKFARFHIEGEFFRWHPALDDFVSKECRLWDGSDEKPSCGPARIDSDVLRIARIVASYEQKSLSDYLSDTLRPIVDRDHAKHIRKYSGKIDPPPDR
jgi:hypothetical protein